MDERSAWIALTSTALVGDEIMALLMGVFGTASGALEAVVDGRIDSWVAQRRRLDGRPPLNGPTLANLRATAARPARVFEEAENRGLWVTTPLDSDFPVPLRDLDPPPPTLFGAGDRATLRTGKAVSIVGTRTPTMAGRALATRVATRLVECGAVVVSGMAVGIDGAAHAATIQAGGRTVAVIGAGHDHPGPRAHETLRQSAVESGGALVSEYAPTVRARKGTFPRRNRIIAALGLATIVIEAPIHSGALITARKAMELGRKVLVAPGRVGDWSAAGSLGLLRDGPALPLVGLDEMVDDLRLLEPALDERGDEHTKGATIDQLLATLGDTERQVAARLLAGPVALDALVQVTELPPAVVSSAVTLLLIRGWAQSVGPAYMAAGALAQ